MKKSISNPLRHLAGAGCLALSLMSAAADYSSTMTSLSPVGYWRLNEPTQPVVPTYPLTNTSSAGSALNGLYYGSPMIGSPGAVSGDTAVSMDGVSQYAEVPNNAALNPNGPFSVEFWANLTNDTAGAKSGVVSRYITVAGGPTGQFGYLFFCNNGAANLPWQFRVYNGTGATTINDAGIGDVQPNTWYHVVGVYDGANAHIYVNGIKTSTTTGTVGYHRNTNAPTRIGAGTPETGPSLFFPGVIDNVAVYNGVLTDSQILAHYEAATTNAAGYNVQIQAENPTAYYAMNEPAVPLYIPYQATNSGSSGSALNGSFTLLDAVTGQAGPIKTQFAGFETDNKSLRLNAGSGTAGRVTIPPVAAMTASDHVTITAWVRRPSNQTQVDTAPIFFNIDTGGNSAGFNFRNSTRELAYHWRTGSRWAWPSTLFVPDDTWTFAALVVTPTNAIMYMGATNGLVSRTNDVSGSGGHPAHDFSQAICQLGAQPGSTRHLKGWLDEVALFDKALEPSQISTLFYSATPAIPYVSRTPAEPAAIYEGMTVSFTAYGVANGPVNYQWRRNGSILGGQTAAVLSLANVNTGNSGNYDVVVTSGANSVTSSVSAITVVAGPPVTFTNPASMTRYLTAPATFTVSAGGSVPLSYQWQKNSNDIVGATSPTLTIPSVAASDAGFYRVKLGNPYGTNFTANATLTVLSEPTPFPNLAIADAPMAYWRFNETSGTVAADYYGGRNGTLVGGVALGTAGPRPASQNGFEAGNNAFTFNGSSTWVDVGPLNFNTNTMTFAAWVKVAAYHSDLSGIIFSRGVTAAGMHMTSSGELRYHWPSGASYGQASGITLPIGQWVFVALVVEPTRVSFYMNDGTGLVSSSAGTTHNVTAGTDPMFIGRDRTDRVFNGDIDEALIFKRSLSYNEILALSYMGVSGPTAPVLVGLPSAQGVYAGQTASFSVGAYGGLPLSYQWNRNGTPIPGATSPTLNLPNAYYTDAGNYSVTVTNAQGLTNSPVAALTVAPLPEFANLTNGLVLHLAFNGNELDSSGRANHGTFFGSTNFVAGKLGAAYQFTTIVSNGIYDYVTLGTPADLQFGADTDFSVAYWAKFTGLPGDQPFLCSAGNSYGNFGLTFAPSWEEGGWSYYLGGASGSAGLYGPANTINDGTWHSLVHSFTRTGNALTYLDGVLVDTRSIAAVGDVDSGLPITIGQDPTGVYGVDTVAAVDDIGIWRKALTHVEAQAIYLVAQNHGKSFDTYGPVKITLKQSGSTLEIIWQAGTLLSADDLTGPWTPVAGATAPFHTVNPTAAKRFYRVQL